MMAGICSNDCWLFHSSFSKFCCLHLDKTSLKVACSGSKESSVFAGPCQLNPDEVTCSSWFSGRKPCKSLRRAKEWGKKSRVGRFSCTLNHGGAVGQKCSLAPQPPALAVMEKVLLGSLADEVSWLWKSESGAGGEKQGKKSLIQYWIHQIQEWRHFPWFCTLGIANTWNKLLFWRLFSDLLKTTLDSFKMNA